MARVTSKAAWRSFQASGIGNTRRGQAYAALYHSGPMTGNELARHCDVPGMWKRLSELKAMGVVVEVGTGVCAVTGVTAYEWDVTAAVPASWKFTRPKARVFYGVKRNGHSGKLYTNKGQAEGKLKTMPGAELIELKEVI